MLIFFIISKAPLAKAGSLKELLNGNVKVENFALMSISYVYFFVSLHSAK
jgi:hypothetical protein